MCVCGSRHKPSSSANLDTRGRGGLTLIDAASMQCLMGGSFSTVFDIGTMSMLDCLETSSNRFSGPT